MGDAILYTILAVFAVYGVYSAIRETVLLISGAFGKGEAADEDDPCSICRGCRMNPDNTNCRIAEEENNDEDKGDT